MNNKIVRILVVELDFMPSQHRWAVDFFHETGNYIIDLTRFFISENLAIDFATILAHHHSLPKTGEHSWELPKT